MCKILPFLAFVTIFQLTESNHGHWLERSVSPNRVPPNGEDPRHREIVNWKQTWPNGLIFFEISPEFSTNFCTFITLGYGFLLPDLGKHNYVISEGENSQLRFLKISDSSSKDLIYEAMAEISSKTCIAFQRRNFEPDYIYIQMHLGDGCHTFAGRKGGKQILNLDPRKCIQHGKAAHELLHVIGFHHEHQRPDRDKYIDIKWDNIKDEDIGQFTKLSAPKSYLQTFQYDYGSLLHYGNISFFLAIDQDKPIIEAKEPAPNMGQRIALSDLDVIKVNALYRCNKLRIK